MAGKTKPPLVKRGDLTTRVKRGDLITISMAGDYGKPRPALVIQSDLFAGSDSLTVLPITSTLAQAPLLRFSLEPNSTNNLQKPSQVMIDKTVTVRIEKVGAVIGRIGAEPLREIGRLLAIFLGIAQ